MISESTDVQTGSRRQLTGVLVVEVDGEQLAEVGSGSVLGERAVLEEGAHTAT